MVWKGRITKQGVRDLNYYGPRRREGAAGALVADEEIPSAARPPVTSAVGAHDGGAVK